MLFATTTEATRTVTAAEFLLALFQGVSVVAALVWVKRVLYHRRREEAEAHRLRREFHQARTPLHSRVTETRPIDRSPRSQASRTLCNSERELRSNSRGREAPGQTIL
jgi:hypothetical protein